jgi:CRP-like cAMP-binding protein
VSVAPPIDLAEAAALFVSVYALAPGSEKPLAELLASRPLKVLDRDQVLFAEHDLGVEMYLLLRGRIVGTRKDTRGNLVRIAGLDAPSVVGHMSVIEAAPRAVTCTARRDGTLLAVIDRTTYQELVESPGPRGSVFRHLLLAAMCEQIAAANERVRSLIDPRAVSDMDDETAEHGIHRASAALGGYHGEAGNPED